MNTDFTDFTYNSLEQIHEISCNPGWRDSPYSAGKGVQIHRRTIEVTIPITWNSASPGARRLPRSS